MRVAVSGGTGLVGRALVGALRSQGCEVWVLSRRPERILPAPGQRAVAFDALAPQALDLRGVDAVVNLAGEPIGQRWTAAHKVRVRESRVRGTAALARAAAESASVSVLVSASAVGIYGARGADLIDETAACGDDFLARVCRAWEEATAEAERTGIRTVRLRIGVVLDREGGALARMLPPFRLGVGGPLGGGAQFMSWIHLADLVRLISFAIEDGRVAGALNGTAPEPVSNREFSKLLGAALHRPAVLPLPAFALRAAFGEMASMLLEGQRVVPAKALELGFQFAHPTLPQALRDALH